MFESTTEQYLNSLLYPESNCCFNGAVKIKTLENHYEALMIMPGSEKTEVNITASSSLLEAKSSNLDYPYGYQIKLSKLVDVEKISSSLKNGVLKITMPKQKSQASDKFKVPIS